jgi:hypothetical protein
LDCVAAHVPPVLALRDSVAFKVGKSSFYVQIKCRGSESEHFNPQGHARIVVDGMLELASELGIPETSLYFVVGFFKQGDIRTVVYYCIPLEELDRFRKTPTSQYRFSVERCEQEIEPEGLSSRSSSRSLWQLRSP